MDDPRRSWETLLDEVTPPASPFGSRRRGFAFQGFDLGFKLPDPLREVPDEVLPAVAAHVGAEDFPAPHRLASKRGLWSRHATAPAGHDIPANVGLLDGDGIAPAEDAGVELHATTTPSI